MHEDGDLRSIAGRRGQALLDSSGTGQALRKFRKKPQNGREVPLCAKLVRRAAKKLEPAAEMPMVNAVRSVEAFRPAPPGLFLALTILVQLGGGLLVLSGLWTRLAAFLLLGFTVVATVLAHDPLGLEDIEFQRQLTTSLEHLAIVGGFILVIAQGAGSISIDGIIVGRGSDRRIS